MADDKSGSSSNNGRGVANEAFECEVITDKANGYPVLENLENSKVVDIPLDPEKPPQHHEKRAPSTPPPPEEAEIEGTAGDQQITDEDFEDLVFEPSPLRNGVEKVTGGIASYVHLAKGSLAKLNLTFGLVSKAIALLLYHIYLIAAIIYQAKSDEDMDWCDGLGFLIIITVIVYIYQICSRILSPMLDKVTASGQYENLRKKLSALLAKPVVKYSLFGGAVIALVVFLIIVTAENRKRLVSVFGIVTILFTGFVFSVHPSKVNWRQVFWGLGIQVLFALMVLKWSFGRAVVACLGDKVRSFLEFTDAGSSFIYGFLVHKQIFNLRALDNTTVTYDVAKELNESKALNLVLFFKTLSNVYFFCFCVYMLFYTGAMQWLVRQIGRLLQITVGTTACESTVSAANIFLSSGESSILIKPYLKLMTRSELHSVFTSGLSTVAGSILAVYIGFGVSASHLLSASVMSSPAALACAKLMYPETKISKTNAENIKEEERTEANILDAASRGATAAIFLVLNITANLIAILAFIAFANAIIGYFGGLLGFPELTFEYIMARCFIPVAWLMGVPDDDLVLIGDILSQNYFVNTITAYIKLGHITPIIEHRSKVIATYALCGFTHPAMIGSQLATLASLEPSRKSDLARVAIRGFCSAVMACCMTACVAGAIID